MIHISVIYVLWYAVVEVPLNRSWHELVDDWCHPEKDAELCSGSPCILESIDFKMQGYKDAIAAGRDANFDVHVRPGVMKSWLGKYARGLLRMPRCQARWRNGLHCSHVYMHDMH